MALRVRGRIVAAIAVVLLIAIFLPPWINVSRYRGRIAASISNALGRPTTIGSISLRLLPQPGFDLGNVNIADDPAFGAEPMLHAEQVTANLRLTSLWRGRLEIAKLTLQYPSLNLVRATDGRWNIENLLEHAARIPTAPTTASRPESRPRFPYIESEGGRINFKLGQEKMVYSLADADFALWLESEEEARTRLKARMVRTDSYLSDTGTFSFEGRFRRAWNLRDTPMSATASIENAQLGQLTKLLDGLDRGWRGAVDANVVLDGTPSGLKISARAGIDDFRRYDITGPDRVRLETRCTAVYSAPVTQFSDINCRMPVSDGAVSLTGTATGGLDLRTYDLALALNKVPLLQIVAVVRHAKKDLPDDLSATGDVSASFAFRKTDENAPALWTGAGKTSDTVLRSSTLGPELPLKAIEFELQTADNARKPARDMNAAAQHRLSKGKPRIQNTLWSADSAPQLMIAPISLSLGAETPATVSASFSLDGYNLSAAGDAQIPRLLQIAKTSGLRPPDGNIEGSAKLNLSVNGKWAGLNSPKPTGTAQLRNIKVRMKGVAAPLHIASATLALGDDSLSASDITGSFEDTHLAFTGSVQMPRQCETIETCPVSFDLRADQLSSDELNRLFNPRVARRPWYAILGRSPEPSVLASMTASGTLEISKLAIKSLIAHRVSANAQLQAGKLALTNVKADIWGGTHVGQWAADFTSEQPTYTGSGTLRSVSMPQVAALIKDNWATGALTGDYTVSLRGFTAADFSRSAAGEINFDWRKGALRHVSLSTVNAPLNFARFDGTLRFRDGKMTLSPETKLVAQPATYQVAGTASFALQLNITLRSGSQAYAISGPLEKPKVISTAPQEAQASLKQ